MSKKIQKYKADQDAMELYYDTKWNSEFKRVK